MPSDSPSNSLTPGPDWNAAPPEKIPAPTVWPAALSLGATLMAWGLISSYLLTMAGLGLAALALAGWIREIRHERTDS